MAEHFWDTEGNLYIYFLLEIKYLILFVYLLDLKMIKSRHKYSLFLVGEQTQLK